MQERIVVFCIGIVKDVEKSDEVVETPRKLIAQHVHYLL
jgi:hypothetical protein